MGASTNIHQVAAKAWSSQAASYEAGRPTYPTAATEFIVNTFALTSTSHVVDVAAGTGKFTRGLRKACESKIVAVEPLAEMIEQFRCVLPDIEIVQGTAEHLPFENESVDLITAAQAFHWFANKEALSEFNRVLKPGGGVALLWIETDVEKMECWVPGAFDIVKPYMSKNPTPLYFLGDWKKVFDLPEIQEIFTPLEDQRFFWTVQNTEDGIWTDMLSSSFIAALSDEERVGLEREMRDHMRRHVPEFSGNTDGNAGTATTTYHYYTDVWWFHKRTL
eukprot:comp12090_c1_seq1/m.6822 comp12090_c1_seq1/g.6822  ORF comp12090_c1_seq1/g.6822 comp12090_c1_seq1/m.6822 type:complete len:277 (-) comp12090_c1_seq1:493-1323(-)